MFDWLYKNAKHLKKVAYVLGGVGVAISTAMSKISPITSWMTNLVSIAFGSGVYSSLKNMEVTESIVAKQKQIVDMGERLSLQRYPKRRQELQSLAGVLNVLHLAGGTVENNVQHTKDDLKKFVPSSKWYVNLNVGVQTVLSFMVIAINSMANSVNNETTSSSSSGSSSLTNKDILNLVFAFTCILAQYGIHTFYTARKLRQMAEETDRLHTTDETGQQAPARVEEPEIGVR